MVAKEASGENNGLRSQSKICRSGARLFLQLVIFSVDCDGTKTFSRVYYNCNACILKLNTCN